MKEKFPCSTSSNPCRKQGLLLGLLAAVSAGAAQATDYEVTVRNLSPGMYFTPFLVAAHGPAASIYNPGVAASNALQALAEGGDIAPLSEILVGLGADIAQGDGLLGPGESVSFMVSDDHGNTVLSLAAMILPSNDGFVALNAVTLPHGAVGTSEYWHALGYDAGTEANDEVIGSGAPGEAGFPAPPPVVDSGLGTGATGVHAPVEGFVSVHKGTLGDLDATGGYSDINAAVHGWLNPIAKVTVTVVDNGQSGGEGPDRVSDLSGLVYSSSAVEIFWSPVGGGEAAVVGYEILRDGDLVASLDAQSYFDSGLAAGTDYTYTVRAIDANGLTGGDASITLTTNRF